MKPTDSFTFGQQVATTLATYRKRGDDEVLIAATEALLHIAFREHPQQAWAILDQLETHVDDYGQRHAQDVRDTEASLRGPL